MGRGNRRSNMVSVKEELDSVLEELYQYAKVYDFKFSGKQVTYYFHSKGVPKRRTIYFLKRNFMHLCGVNRYPGGWRKFYNDCMGLKVRTGEAYAIKKEYVVPKIKALGNIDKLLRRGYVGFSDDAVVHKKTNYGEMVRTREDLIALGTVRDSKNGFQVPLSLINMEVSSDGMKVSTSSWCKVHTIVVKEIDSKNTGTYDVEHKEEDSKEVEEDKVSKKKHKIKKQKEKNRNNKSKRGSRKHYKNTQSKRHMSRGGVR